MQQKRFGSPVSKTTGNGNLREVGMIWEIAEVISAIMELRDPFTACHQRRVVHLAVALGAAWGLDASYLNGLRVAASVHDIGKIAVPVAILHKPGKLKEQEFNIIKIHPQVGYDTLTKFNLPWPVSEIVLQHHERLDGSGYPLGLSGEAIHLETKILTVANVVEAMTSPTPYRAAHSLEAALEEINIHRGGFYDPEVVDICTKLFIGGQFRFE
jgi:HD-GYP domain-containing protein (c-di-GMP phosphodiesterase class II)